jgi:hypothetical protein
MPNKPFWGPAWRGESSSIKSLFLKKKKKVISGLTWHAATSATPDFGRIDTLRLSLLIAQITNDPNDNLEFFFFSFPLDGY